MWLVSEHRDATKDLHRLPASVRQAFEVVRAGLGEGAFPEGLRETIRRPNRRLFVIWGVVATAPHTGWRGR